MIIIKLIGGLGNQMFQYGMARRVAHVNKTLLKLDIGEFDIYKLHKYSLYHFNISENIATTSDINSVKKSGIRKLVKLFTEVFMPYYCRSELRERSLNFDPNMLKAPNHVYIEGHWQSEKYFRDIEYIIRKEYVIKSKMDVEGRKIAAKIMRVNSVNVHVRRKDYASDRKTNQVHGTCSIDYYQKAIKKIASEVKNPHFFIFSDDKDWVKKKFNFIYTKTFVDFNNADKNYEDLKLMSLCKHHVIANSTFSWWGAWLAKNENKIVIAPKKWFNTLEYDTSDLIPNGWHTL